MSEASFEPEAWLYNGTRKVTRGDGSADWQAIWKAGETTARLTMAGQPGTQVYLLETYPVDNAVITENHPPCPALCVRRTEDGAFLAAWDAWKDTPNLESVTRVPGQNALVLKTRENTYRIKFGGDAVSFPDGLTLEGDGDVTLLRNRDALAFAGGTFARGAVGDAYFRLDLNAPGNAEISGSPAGPGIMKTCPIAYDTYGGSDHPRDVATLELKCEGNLLSR